jgi:hypothetical protein
MNVLTYEEFHATYCDPMKNITGANLLVDVWAYADKIIASDYHNCTAWDWRVEHVYETGDNVYQHISIPIPKDNTYLVVVVVKETAQVLGHHLLDLRAMYTESDSSET